LGQKEAIDGVILVRNGDRRARIRRDRKSSETYKGTTEKNAYFCDIVEKKASADIVYENEQVVAFQDIRQRVHVLIVPKTHPFSE
jgi:hypothetical protein